MCTKEKNPVLGILIRSESFRRAHSEAYARGKLHRLRRGRAKGDPVEKERAR